jgi:membrane protein
MPPAESSPTTPEFLMASRAKRILQIPALFHRAFLRAIKHDLFNLAQSTAYSAMVALFPALIVIAAGIGLLPDTTPARFQLSEFFDRVLPSDVSPILQSYFVEAPHSERSTRVLLLAVIVSVTGASSVIAKLMEGLRRAHHLPPNCWSVWRRRGRAYLLVPLSLLPFVITSILVVFGHIFTVWLDTQVMPAARLPVNVLAFIIRWTVALAGSIGLLALLYHMGTPMQQTWKRTIPGAIAATAMWFISTLVFGWYVTRFANYSQVYGSLGAGIALLFWLYIIALSILCGAEFNAQFDIQFAPPTTAETEAETEEDAEAEAKVGTKAETAV